MKPESYNGYGYLLKKHFSIKENTFTIHYTLKNTGEKTIITDEYVHNFVAIDNSPINQEYALKFPFQPIPSSFIEHVNPENKINFIKSNLVVKDAINDVFFFSNLSGGKEVPATWTLTHKKSGISVSEIGDFETHKINVWGKKSCYKHRAFKQLIIPPNETTQWSRTYVFESL